MQSRGQEERFPEPKTEGMHMKAQLNLPHWYGPPFAFKCQNIARWVAGIPKVLHSAIKVLVSSGFADRVSSAFKGEVGVRQPAFDVSTRSRHQNPRQKSVFISSILCNQVESTRVHFLWLLVSRTVNHLPAERMEFLWLGTKSPPLRCCSKISFFAPDWVTPASHTRKRLPLSSYWLSSRWFVFTQSWQIWG